MANNLFRPKWDKNGENSAPIITLNSSSQGFIISQKTWEGPYFWVCLLCHWTIYTAKFSSLVYNSLLIFL